jgi:hypothetical protein
MNATAMVRICSPLGLGAVPYPMAARILRDRLFTHGQLLAQEQAVKPDPPAIDLIITQTLSDEPVVSVRRLALRTCFPKSTVYYHLVNTLGFTARHLRLIPYALSQDRKHVRVDMLETFPAQAHSVRHNRWRNFATLNGNWFCYPTDFESIWLPGDEKAPERERRMRPAPK